MDTLQSGKAGTFIQVDPLAEMEFLTAIGIEGVTIPRQSQTVVYLPDLETGEFVADDFVAGEKAEATIRFNRPFFDTYNYLLELGCRFNMKTNLQCAGERSVKANYESALLLVQAIFESGEIDVVQVVQPGDNARVNTTGSAKSLKWGTLRKLTGARQGIAATQDVNDIAFLKPQCYSKCSIYRGLGQVGYAVLDTDYLGIYGDTVLKTIDYGANWNPTVQSPFTVLGRNAQAVLVIPLTGTEHRVVVGGGPMAATYPEIGYSDGTRNTTGNYWTNLNPAAVAGHANIGINAFARDSLGRVWAAADNGRIYVSKDEAENWDISEDAQETNQNVNDIVFYGANIGYAACNNNEILRTVDGNDWNLITGPAAAINLLSVEVNYLGYVFVGTAAGTTWMSYDGGNTWVQIAENIPAAGTIDRIMADPYLNYVMWLIHNDTGPAGTVYRSEDGGVTFSALNMAALNNNGLNALAVCNLNTAYIGGNIVNLTGFIGKFQRRA